MKKITWITHNILVLSLPITCYAIQVNQFKRETWISELENLSLLLIKLSSPILFSSPTLIKTSICYGLHSSSSSQPLCGAGFSNILFICYIFFFSNLDPKIHQRLLWISCVQLWIRRVLLSFIRFFRPLTKERQQMMVLRWPRYQIWFMF